MVSRLLERDARLWLSRSWTTRPRRPGERADAYSFVDQDTFDQKVAADGFLEWAEFLGHCYGTPHPEPPPGRDVVLEIDLQGARQVRSEVPEAVVVLLVPPSPDVQRQRLRGRGDSEEEVVRRIAKGEQEAAEGRSLADHVVVNDDLDRAVSELAGIMDAHRSGAGTSPGADSPQGRT